MRTLTTLLIRIALIPVVLGWMLVAAMWLVIMAFWAPFLCLFGKVTITRKDKDV